MSMHQYMPDQAVLADSWTLFCPECAQKMRIIMAAPTQVGREEITYECVYGHRERMILDLPGWTTRATLRAASA
jgi:lysyl-tRNA synthetase class I